MKYDLVIIGAGINGAGIAQAAAASGYSVLVLEQYEKPGLGTSSRSSKLIHGGLRYLESGQFQLVYEGLRERGYLLRNAPHLVRLIPFHIPIFHHTRRRPWLIAIGLAIYTLFSRKPFHWIRHSHWRQLEGLKTDHLDAVLSYYDAQTDDACLTRSVLASARQLGATVKTDSQFRKASLHQGRYTVYYHSLGEIHQITTPVLINAAGPWANQVLNQISPLPQQRAVDLVQGTHIVIQKTIHNFYYLEAPQDERAVFIMPWRGNTLVGTTEVTYQGDPAEVVPLESEINYLLEVYNHHFEQPIQRVDVMDSFAGLRVLPAGKEGIFQRSRDTLINSQVREGTIITTIYGGKLTVYRSTAEKVLRELKRYLPPKTAIADTRHLPLPEIDCMD